jgi:hypothetical protein
MRVFVPLLLMAVSLCDCAHKFTPETVGLMIVVGKTTKKEILNSFGEPDRKSKTIGMKIVTGKTVRVIQKPQEIWWYSPHEIKWFDVIEPEPLKIVFDDKGVVARYDFAVDED